MCPTESVTLMEDWSLILLGKFCKLVKNMSGSKELGHLYSDWQRGLQRTVKPWGEECRAWLLKAGLVCTKSLRGSGQWARCQQHLAFSVNNWGKLEIQVSSHYLLQGIFNPGIEPRSPALQADSLPLLLVIVYLLWWNI